MSQHVDTNNKSFTAGAAIAEHLRVKLSVGKLVAAGAADRSIGTMAAPSFADGDVVGVSLRNKVGTKKMVAAAAITSGAFVYSAASGKVSSSGIFVEGQALEAAGADGDVIEVLPVEVGPESVATVASAGSAQGDAAALTGKTNNVTGADGTKGVILPSVGIGETIEVYNAVATNGLKIYPPTSGTINGGSANAAITIEGKTTALVKNLDGTNWSATFTVNT